MILYQNLHYCVDSRHLLKQGPSTSTTATSRSTMFTSFPFLQLRLENNSINCKKFIVAITTIFKLLTFRSASYLALL